MTTTRIRDSLLTVENLRTTFDTPRGHLTAVDGVSFALGRAETLGIVGESGSGKSVLVRSIMNLLGANATVAEDSKVMFDGRDVHRLSRWESRHFWGTEIAMVFQDPMTSLNPVKRIGVQLTESMRFHLGLNSGEATERALELLDQVRIPEPRRRMEQYPHELSGGMRQRVMIAIALACKPRLLVADEPTTALDVTVQKQILDLLTRLQAELDMAMILITHDLGVVSGHTDRVAVMYAGQLVEVADTNELFGAVQHPYTGALLNSIPKIEQPSHTRLEVINGWPPDLIRGIRGCRFAPRCRSAQAACLEEAPGLRPTGDREHMARCFFPLGSEGSHQAMATNLRAGQTAAGLDLTTGAE
ncbi:ABC transporter ATP-binding protein [Rhodococcus sp. T2V]|uniref:ABC transporter ATP-binding protein n=1 Tax=Rhodococcus sp. T2V TaxID=3034164 RepID=UPI0023E1DC94|nr:ABC transporter ATP-binding protein [Rhodococcus sp. T2V]MDF3312224.1 ABC transporter ATP-binding protein [Rhodococcus sp. T2V]